METLKENNLFVISLGGSLVSPKTGFDPVFLKAFKALISAFIEEGKRFIIVTGGGNTARQYQAIAKEVGKLEPDDVDWIGIHATRLNAHLMRTIFRDLAYKVVVKDPTKKINWKGSKILIGAGWKPGWSTDYVSVKLAEAYGAKTVINMSNIDYVYDKDPRNDASAKKLENISWKDFRKIVGDKWIPGANLPFDPIASKEAEKLKLKVKFVKGTDLNCLSDAICDKIYKGSLIG